MGVVVRDVSEIRIAAGVESISIFHSAVQKESSFSCNNLPSSGVSDHCFENDRHSDYLAGVERCRALSINLFAERKFSAWKRVVEKIGTYPKVECWRLPRVFDNDFGASYSICDRFRKASRINSDVCPQLLLGCSPSLGRVNGQDAGKHSHQKRAEKIYEGFVAITPREEFVFVSTVVLLCSLPFIAAWFGYSGWGRTCWGLVISWWLLIASVFLNVGRLWG